MSRSSSWDAASGPSWLGGPDSDTGAVAGCCPVCGREPPPDLSIAGHWVRQAQRLLRLAFKRKCWALLGQWLNSIKRGNASWSESGLFLVCWLANGLLAPVDPMKRQWIMDNFAPPKLFADLQELHMGPLPRLCVRHLGGGR